MTSKNQFNINNTALASFLNEPTDAYMPDTVKKKRKGLNTNPPSRTMTGIDDFRRSQTVISPRLSNQVRRSVFVNKSDPELEESKFSILD